MIDFDALVLGAVEDVFGVSAVLTPIASQPGDDQIEPGQPFPVRGIYTLKPADIEAGEDPTVRADEYTFMVRAAELPVPVTRGDQLSEIALPFLVGRIFTVDDTGDDGQGGQLWVLRSLDPPSDHPADDDA